MEMKDIILSTLKEIEDGTDGVFDIEEQIINKRGNASQAMMSMTQKPPQPQQVHNNAIVVDDMIPSHYISTEEFMSNDTKPITKEPSPASTIAKSQMNNIRDVLEDEKVFLNSVRERLLVLFEGLQSPNNRNIEAKVDLIINFLEYKLAVVDERLEKIQRTILSL